MIHDFQINPNKVGFVPYIFEPTLLNNSAKTMKCAYLPWNIVYAQYAHRTLNEIESTFNETFAGKKHALGA